MKKYIWMIVSLFILECFAGCGTQTQQQQQSQVYENETLGFSFEIPLAWKDNYEVKEHVENGITYTDFYYVYGWPQKQTTLLVSIIATDEATWTNQQLENNYYLMAINRDGIYFANKVPLVPEEVPFKEGSKKAKEFQKLLLSLQEVGKQFSLSR